MAGMSLRLARSPLAPKMTMAHEGAVGITRSFPSVPKSRRERGSRLRGQGRSPAPPAQGAARIAPHAKVHDDYRGPADPDPHAPHEHQDWRIALVVRQQRAAQQD